MITLGDLTDGVEGTDEEIITKKNCLENWYSQLVEFYNDKNIGEYDV